MKRSFDQLLEAWQKERENTGASDGLSPGPDCLSFAEAKNASEFPDAIPPERNEHLVFCIGCQRLVRLFEEEFAPNRPGTLTVARQPLRISGHPWAWASLVVVACVLFATALLPRRPSGKLPTSTPAISVWSGPVGITRGPESYSYLIPNVRISSLDSVKSTATLSWIPPRRASCIIVSIRKPPGKWSALTLLPPTASTFEISLKKLGSGFRYEVKVESIVAKPPTPRYNKDDVPTRP